MHARYCSTSRCSGVFRKRSLLFCANAAQAGSGADLVLSGHTHGGQMIPLVQLIRWFHIVDDNVYGYERRENTDFIVTSGISDWALQFKTGCWSEYVIIDISGS